MKKKISFLMALAMSFAMVGATACNKEPEEKGLLKVETATAEQLAAFNATNITDYVNGTPVVLETAYTFTALETAEEAAASEYANWWADYYVSVDTDVAAGAIGLAGSYDSWDSGAWIAFYSPVDLAANEELGLLESTGKKAWTYAGIVENVGTFRCGAFDLNDACAGVTLKVELRLTNPEDATDTISVCVIEYKFA